MFIYRGVSLSDGERDFVPKVTMDRCEVVSVVGKATYSYF